MGSIEILRALLHQPAQQPWERDFSARVQLCLRHMHIFIDEAGPFIPPPTMGSPSYSLVLALVVPTSTHDQLCYDFLRIRDAWPHNWIEVKGNKLDETQYSEIAFLLGKYDALIEIQIVDMGLHDVACIKDFKERQAQSVTAKLTPHHQPTMIRQLSDLAGTFRSMANQLFVQAFLMIQLVIKVCESWNPLPCAATTRRACQFHMGYRSERSHTNSHGENKSMANRQGFQWGWIENSGPVRPDKFQQGPRRSRQT